MKFTVGVLAAIVAVALIPTPSSFAATPSIIHRITFPVEGKVSYSDDFGNARSGGRTHEGNDIMGSKMQKVLAATNGTITSQNFSNGGLSGNFMQLTGDDGWKYWYIHLNNDTPGTDDGVNNPAYITPGITVGMRVTAGQHIGYMGDSGNAEGTSPHLHFEMHLSDGTVVNPYGNLRLSQGKQYGNYCAFDSNPTASGSTSSARGYWQLGSDGGIFSFGDAPFYGSMGGKPLNRPVVSMTATKTGNGYYLLASDGGIFTFGDAVFYGSTGNMRLNQPIVGMAITPSGKGYYLVASDGGIFTFGDAVFYGSTGNIRLNQPVRGMVTTSNGAGYWMFANDGGMFTFGNATFKGSLVGITKTNAAAMEPTPSGNGYWILGADAGIFSFGDAGYYGSIPGFGFCTWPNGVDIGASSTGGGYWVQASDGTIWGFGNSKYYGSVAELKLPVRVIDLTIRR